MSKEHDITINNYDYFSKEYFFVLNGDHTRLVIMIFILISFILTIFIIFMLHNYRKKREFSSFSLSGLLSLNILIENFFRTFSYIFNWLIKDDNTKFNGYNIGALLNGNPSNFNLCIVQGFLLIFLSISQDIITNIFFSFVNVEQQEKKHLYIIILLIAGYIFPASVSFFYYKFEIIGINEKFCYIEKYSFKIDDEKNEVIYHKEKNYKLHVLYIFIIRSFNFFITLYYIIRAIRYIKNIKNNENDAKAGKLFSSLPVVFVSSFTLFIELIFRFLSFIDIELEEKLIGIYIIMNSADSILLPLSFFLKHKIYRYFCCCIRTKIGNYDENNDENNDSSIKDIEISTLIPPEKLKDKELLDLLY